MTDIGREVVGLILSYAKIWRLLLDYDEGKLSVPVGAQPAKGVLRFEEARRALDALTDLMVRLVMNLLAPNPYSATPSLSH